MVGRILIIAVALAAAIAAPAEAGARKAPSHRPPAAGHYSGGWGPHRRGSHFTAALGSGTYHQRIHQRR